MKTFYFIDPDLKVGACPSTSFLSPPSTDNSEGAREMGRFWDGRRLLMGIEDVKIYTLAERVFLWRKRNEAGSVGRTVTEERVRVAGTGSLL